MSTVREDHTATLLQNGKILVAGGFTGTTAINTAELYDPASGTWTPTGSLNVPRSGHTATLLRNDKVLVVGGYNTDYLTSAELYDPVSGTWALTGPVHVGRYAFTATLMLDGKVLVAGGSSNNTNTPTAELYDPATESWTQTGNLHDGRVEPTATLLPDGRVLVAGGLGNPTNFSGAPVLSSMELYDPLVGTWSQTGPLTQARLGHTATLLPNGLVLLTGGGSAVPDGYLSTELYDPATGTATLAAPMNSGRIGHSATLLPNGTVMVIGGETGPGLNSTNSAEVYDPATGSWTLTNSLNTARDAHTATLLPNGKILVTGGGVANGAVTSTTELYDPTIAPTTGAWTYTTSMHDIRDSLTATLLADGQVLVSGGVNLASCELYNPVTKTWTDTGSMNRARYDHSATLLPNGKVLVLGGITGIPVAELYDPVTGTWTTNAVPAANGDTATVMRNGKVLIAGPTWLPATALLYDPNSDSWTVTGSMITERAAHLAVLLPNGKVMVVGGGGFNDKYISNAELYDPASGQWTYAGQTRVSSYDTAAVLLPSGKVFVTGTATNGSPVADLFDPQTGLWTATAAPSPGHFPPTLTLLPNGKVLLIGEGAPPEMYDPSTGQWATAADLNVDRAHYGAVLLADSRLLVAGGVTRANSDTSSAELYDPGLTGTNSWRPQIASITSPLNLGDALTVVGTGFRGIAEGSSGSFQDSGTDYPLVQLRNIGSGQTTFLLTTNWSTNSFTSLPVWNFPPGQAFATVFVNGIQSTSSIVNVAVPVPAMTTLTSVQTSTNGSIQFAFTNNPGAVFGMLASTNLSLPSSNWTKLGGVIEVAPGQFQFSDPQAANNLQNFYQLFAP
ncbi:MAG TPA: kelch repeat-containing protein [Verrucomicrobiae bacterium]|jgi:N-acetylneuraminic acid mutarotase|nr:kelch repeat-containing protein [Verrucomicrobiae bacterium]